MANKESRLQMGERSKEWILAQNPGEPDPKIEAIVLHDFNYLISAYRSTKFTKSEAKATMKVWVNTFEHVSAKLFHQAIYRLIETDEESFFPTPGKVAACVARLVAESAEEARIAEAARISELRRIARFKNPEQEPVNLELLVDLRKCGIFENVELAPFALREMDRHLDGIGSLASHMGMLLDEMGAPFGGGVEGLLNNFCFNIICAGSMAEDEIKAWGENSEQWAVKPGEAWTEPSVLDLTLEPLIGLGMERYKGMAGDEKKALAAKAACAMGRLSEDICSTLSFFESCLADLATIFSKPAPGRKVKFCDYLQKAKDQIRNARERLEKADFEAVSMSFTSSGLGGD
ncbi:MAG: hypothetical protein LBT59_13590 [Clostridiales bacterium]|jgi:hypothetical protein|nr:hypothetical protein [Clostridiales bacterium]